MPNDNTHATKNGEPLLDRCKCGGEAGIDLTDFEWASSQSFHVKCLKCGVRTPIGSAKSPMSKKRAIKIWNTRTPAEPKAGDWEAELKCCIDLVPALINAIFELDSDHAMIEIAAHAHEKAIRALSSAAPRITERKWISVDERLPELFARVLLCTADAKVGEGQRDEGHYVWAGGTRVDDVTYFMLLPNPPPFTPTQTDNG